MVSLVAQTSTAKIRCAQIGPAKVGLAQVGTAQTGSDEVGTCETCPGRSSMTPGFARRHSFDAGTRVDQFYVLPVGQVSCPFFGGYLGPLSLTHPITDGLQTLHRLVDRRLRIQFGKHQTADKPTPRVNPVREVPEDHTHPFARALSISSLNSALEMMGAN